MENNKKIQFAPVIIPTLCRIRHFQRCLDSLNKCIGAEYTDVYVAVDYPAKPSHFAGWNAINEYLDSFESHFKSLNIIKRDHNYGLGRGGNWASLHNEIATKYDRYIMSEDDNEFSPNFLLFVNRNLEKYKDNPNVMFVCGYNYPVNIENYFSNSYPSYQFSAWGYGTWTEKQKKFLEYNTVDTYKSYFTSWKKLWKIFKNEPRMINVALQLIHENRVAGDSSRVLYQLAYDKVSIFPVISKVRNWGMDMSGFSKVSKPELATQRIDENLHYEEESISLIMRSDIRLLINKYFDRTPIEKVGILLRLIIYKISGWDYIYFIRSINQ